MDSHELEWILDVWRRKPAYLLFQWQKLLAEVLAILGERAITVYIPKKPLGSKLDVTPASFPTEVPGYRRQIIEKNRLDWGRG